MTNGEQPILDNQFEDNKGLTKREYFAGLAMIGLYSMKDAICWTDEDIAKMAVKQSDALLAELEYSQEGQ
ncbi:MAG: hypothetical protein RL078_1200 [Bacteroidota bacterium]|jgi:hypothetical protein